MTEEEKKKIMDDLREKYEKMPLVDLTDPENFRKMVLAYTANIEKHKKRIGIRHINLKRNPRYKSV